MTSSPFLSFILSAGLLAPATGVLADASRAVFEDDFATRDKWLTSLSSDELTASDNALRQQLDETPVFGAYLTDTAGETFTLDEGQRLRVTYSVSFENMGSNAYFRWGVFDTSFRPRLTGDGIAGGFSSNIRSDSFRDSLGYVVWMDGQNEGRQVSVRRRRGEDETGLMNSSNRYFTATGTDSLSEAIQADTLYHGVFEVVHHGVNNMQYSASKWRVNDQGALVYLYDFETAPDTSSTTYSPNFDFLAFSVGSSAAEAVRLHSIKVEVIDPDWVTEYASLDAPFHLEFGIDGEQENGSSLLRNRPGDFQGTADGLLLSPASDSFASTAALAVVENYQPRQDFTLEATMTLDALFEEAANRFGFVVLAGPHLPGEASFNVSGDQSFYSATWFPAESGGGSVLEIREGFDGATLATVNWTGKVPASGEVELFFEDFEDPEAAERWSSDGSLWEIGEPHWGPESAVSGSRVAGTNLSGAYPEYTDEGFLSPVIDLTGIAQATLEFWEFTQVDTESVEYHSTTVSILDASNLELVVDGVLSRDADQTGNWRHRSLQLPPDALGREIVVEFRLKSDGHAGWTHAGWYLDDVRVTGLSASDPGIYAMKVDGTYGSDGSLELAFNLTDEDEHSQTVTAVILEPLGGNLFGVGGRTRVAAAGAPMVYFHDLTMTTGDVSPPDGTTFAEWQSLVFTEPQLGDPSLSGPLADPAGDGVANLLKYAFGLLPFSPATLSDLAEYQRVDGILYLTYVERVEAADLVYTPEASSDLASWAGGEGHVQEVAREELPGDEFQLVTVRAAAGPEAARAFLRVRVTQN